MKKIILLFMILVNALYAGAIREVKLDSKKINIIYVSLKDPLSLVMPFDLIENGVIGGDITNDPSKMPAGFYINYQAGGKLIALRALKENAVTHINIVSDDNEVFVLRLKQSETEADSAITFKEKNLETITGEGTYTPQLFSAYLERTNNYPFLKIGESELIDNSDEFGLNTNQAFANGTKMKIDRVVRWNSPHPNVVVFNGTLTNPTNQPIYYDRHSFSMKIGTAVFKANIAMASGVIPAGKTSPFQFGLSRKDYPQIMNVDLKKNTINYALTFIKEGEVPNRNLLLPEIPDNAK